MSEKPIAPVWAMYYMFKHARKWQPEIENWGDGQSIVLRLDGNYFDRSKAEMQELLAFWQEVHSQATLMAAELVETARTWNEPIL